MRKIALCFLAFILLTLPSLADEGMWIPMLLKKYNIEDMQKAGQATDVNGSHTVGYDSANGRQYGSCGGSLVY